MFSAKRSGVAPMLKQSHLSMKKCDFFHCPLWQSTYDKQLVSTFKMAFNVVSVNFHTLLDGN